MIPKTFLFLLALIASLISFVAAAPTPTGNPPTPTPPPEGLGLIESTGLPPIPKNESIPQALVDDPTLSKRQLAGYPTIWVTAYGSGPFLEVNGEEFTPNGWVWVGIYKLGTSTYIYGNWIHAYYFSGYPGGSFGLPTGIKWYSGPPANLYAQAYDSSTGYWSNAFYLRTC
jgi:hypothetical protein